MWKSGKNNYFSFMHKITQTIKFKPKWIIGATNANQTRQCFTRFKLHDLQNLSNLCESSMIYGSIVFNEKKFILSNAYVHKSTKIKWRLAGKSDQSIVAVLFKLKRFTDACAFVVIMHSPTQCKVESIVYRNSLYTSVGKKIPMTVPSQRIR